MSKRTPFTLVSQKMLDRWLEIELHDRVSPEDIYSGVLDLLSLKMRLSVFIISGDDPLKWALRTIRHSGFTTSLFNVNKSFENCLVGEFRDQEYMAQAVIPRLQQVIENRQPSMELVKTKLFGISVGYDRILLPQRTKERPKWVISSSYARFLVDTPKSYGAFDIADEAVVQLLQEGCTAKEIASKLNISQRTVEHRLERLKDRFGARNTLHLAVMLISGHLDDASGSGRDIASATSI